MTKRSKYERAQRGAESDRTKQIEAAWAASVPADTAKAFAREVEAVIARGPMPRQPDMAPGTLPRPPRPGREPKVKKEETRSRRSY